MSRGLKFSKFETTLEPQEILRYMTASP